MAGTIGQYQQGAFSTPVNGTLADAKTSVALGELENASPRVARLASGLVRTGHFLPATIASFNFGAFFSFFCPI